MTIYYQHVGEEMTARDFPQSIGSDHRLVRFHFSDIEPFLGHLHSSELMEIKSRITDLAPTGFQVWGIPSGAQTVLKNMSGGDYLLLLESIHFAYCGQVLHRVSEMCYDLSENIWGEERFPIIILLQGELINYSWIDFVEHFGYKSNYRMRGQTSNIADRIVASSPSETEEDFITELMTTKRV